MPSVFNPFTNRYHEVDEQTASIFSAPRGRTVYNPFTRRQHELSAEDTLLFYPEFAEASAPPVEQDVEWADYGKSIMAGGASVVSGLGWLADRLDGETGIGEAIMSVGNRAVDYWNESLSEPAKRELAKEFVVKTEDEGYEWGDASLSTVGLLGAQSLLGTAAGAGIGAGATKVLQLFGNPAGRATLARAAQLGAKARPGTRAAAMAEQARKKLRFVDQVLGAAGFGIGEGTIGGAMTGVNVETEVMKLPDERLLSTDRGRQIFDSTEGLMEESKRMDYVRSTLAKEASSTAGWQAGLTTAVLGAPLGAYFGPLFSKVATGRPGSILKGAAGEAAQEFGQSGAEQMISNLRTAEVGADVGAWENVLNAAIGGTAAGAPIGGVLATAGPTDRQVAEAEATRKQYVAGGVNYAPLVANARQAKEAGATDEEVLPILQGARQPGKLIPALAELRRLRDAKLAEAATAEPQEMPESAKSEQPDALVPTVGTSPKPEEKEPVTTPEALEAVAQEAATSPANERPEPTEAQIEAGNYRKPRVKIPHLPEIRIENPKGSKRKGKRPDGTEWEHELTVNYGYFTRTTGADNREDGTPREGVDVFVGPNATDPALPAFVIDQKNADGSFDEHKVMVGFATEDEARQAYLAQYDEGWDGLGAITEMPAEELKAFINDDERTSRPVAYQPAEEQPDGQQEEEAQATSEADVLTEPLGGEEAEPVAQPQPEALVQQPAIRDELERLKGESGWDEIDGRMIRKTEDVDSIDYKEVVGRTKWLPRADWWPGRPGAFNEAQTERIIDRGVAGEPLGKRQQEYFEYLLDIARERVELSDYAPTESDVAEAGLEGTTDDQFEAAYVARELEDNEEAVERIAIQYADDDAGFLRALKQLRDARSEVDERGADDRGPAEGRDLLGDDTRTAQALADETRRRDAQRNAGQDSIETGDPTDLFSQARQQTDLVDAAAPGEPPADDFVRADEPAIPANPVDPSLPPVEKAKALHALGRENQPPVDRALARIDEELGFKSKSNFKAIPTIIAKARRPEFQRKNPGGGVEHVRDSFRFKSVLPATGVPDIERAVAIMIEETGATILKSDFTKIATPERWGWRMIAFDLQMPNGQIVEWYLPLTEMAAANSGGNHALFEKWREKDPKKLTAPEQAARRMDINESRRRYDAAFQAAAESAGLSVTELIASFTSLEASMSSVTSIQPSLISSSEIGPQESKDSQVPRTRIIESPEGGQRTSTSSPSRDLSTSVVTDEIIPESEPESLGEDVTEPALRSRRKGKTGLKAATVTSKLKPAIDAVSPLLTVRAVQSVNELPGNAAPSDTEGVYFNRGAVYLVADNLSEERIEEVFRHEVFGHAAMERHADFPKWLAQIERARRIKGSTIQKLAAEVASRQGLLDPVTEAKEIIALMAERGIKNSLLDRIVAAFRKFFRSIGLLKDVTAAEVRTWLANGARQFMNDAELARRVPGATLTAESTDEEVLAAINAVYPGEAVDALYQRVFHGSPHRFERFSLDAIGTGEGAQAYGWGLYFAENPEVANSYRSAVGYKQIVREFRERLPDDADFEEVMELVESGHFDEKQAVVLRALADDDWLGFDYPAQAISAAFSDLGAYDPSPALQEAVDNYGALYEAEIPDDVADRMLDWDARLRDQPAAVREALEGLAEGDGVIKAALESDATTGGGLYGALAANLKDWSGREASLMLNGLGIPGIKYLDQMSRPAKFAVGKIQRSASGGWVVVDALGGKTYFNTEKQAKQAATLPDDVTRNIVLFDPELITEVRRDGEVVSTQELPEPSGTGRALYSRAVAAADVEEAMARVMVTPNEDLTVADRVRLWWRDLTDMQEGRIKQGLLDSAHSIRLLEEGLFGEVLDATDSAYKATLATKNLPSVVAAIMKRGAPEITNGVFQPVAGRKGVIEIFQRVTDHADGNLLAQWEFFAAANRASRLITEENPDGTLREKNFSPADIEKGLSLEQQYPFFREVLEEWTGFNQQILDVAEAAGVVNAEERALWEKNDYVPFYRAMGDDVKGPRGKRGIADQRSGVRRLKGSEAALGSVFENMMMNVAHLVDASFRNVAMQRVTAMGEQTGAMEKLPPQWAPVSIDNRQIVKRLQEAGIEVGELNDEQKESWSKLFRRVAPAGKDVVSVMIDGKPQWYRVTDPMLLSSITLMGQESYSALMGLFRTPKKWLTTGVTATPEFMLANLIRDTLSTWVVSDIRKNPFKGVGSAMKATFKEHDDLMAIMMAGAGGGGYYDSNPEQIRKLLAKEMPRDKVDGFLKTILHPKSAWRFWQRVGASTENANRIAIFRQVIANGGSVAEAAHQARDVLNFTMSGDFAAIRVLIQTVPFLNARIQGLYRLARGAKANPKAFAAKGLVLMALTLALLARNNDEEEYEELPEWDKDTYWHIFVGGEHVRIPKPFEVGAMFATLPERLVRTVSGNDDMALLTERVQVMLLETFAFNPVPQLVKPIVEQYANRNMFTGSPIVGMAEKGLEPEAQYTHYTSEAMRALAEGMPDAAPPWLRSPRRLEAAIRGYFGSLGTYALGTADAVVRTLGGYPAPPSGTIYDLPLVQRFLRSPEPRQSRYQDMLYDMLDQSNQVFRTINRYKSQGLMEKARELQDEKLNVLKVRKRLNRIQTSVRKLNAQMKLTMFNRSLRPDEKRQRMDALQAKKNDLLAQVAPFEEHF